MINWKAESLGAVADMTTDKISVNKLSIENYISTENMLPDRGGVAIASKLPTSGSINAFFPGDVLFSNIRTYFKKVWLAQRHGGASADVIVFRPKDCQKVDSQYLYYVLSSDAFIESTVIASKGTKMPRGDKDAMLRYMMPLPPLPIQQRIAGILSAYDELIENSQRRIKLLEAMARALYREWFVHFRFPGHENHPRVPSPLGEIPQGWEVKKLKDVCRLTMGQSPKSEFYNEAGDGVAFHQGVTDFGDRFPSDRLFCTADGRIAEAGDILFSVRAPVGRMNIANKKILLGRGLSAIRHNQGCQAFLWEQLKNRFTEVDMMGNGSIFASVTKDDMQGIELLCPSPPLIEVVTKHFDPVHSEIAALGQQIQTLRSTRDLLLPRLLSGQIDVKTIPYA